MTRGKRAKLSAEDRALWRRVTQTVSPMRPAEEPVEAAPAEEGKPPRKPTPSGGALPPAPKPASPKPPPTPRSHLDRRLVKRLGRGAAAVDAVVDLHGLTQNEAHDRLIAFLSQSQAAGRRVVLVVTGKGRVGEASGDWWEEGSRGILRRAVPKWLAAPPLRAIVVGFERAHERRGGEGAIYVQLRRRNRDGTP